jgi:hypothetical protein
MNIPLLLYIEQYLQTCISSIACTPWFGSSHLLYQTLSMCSICLILTHPVLLLNTPSNTYVNLASYTVHQKLGGAIQGQDLCV